MKYVFCQFPLQLRTSKQMTLLSQGKQGCASPRLVTPQIGGSGRLIPAHSDVILNLINVDSLLCVCFYKCEDLAWLSYVVVYELINLTEFIYRAPIHSKCHLKRLYMANRICLYT